MKNMVNWQYTVHTQDSPSNATGRSYVSEKRILARERFRTQLIDRTIKGPTRWTRSVTDVNLAKFKDQFRNLRNHDYMTYQWHGNIANGHGSRNLASNDICSNQYRTPTSDANRPTTHPSQHQHHLGTHAIKLPPVTSGIPQTPNDGKAQKEAAATKSTSQQRTQGKDSMLKSPAVLRMPSSAGHDIASGGDEQTSPDVEILTLGKEALALLEREQMNSMEMTKKWIAECEFEMTETDGSEGYFSNGDTKPVRRVRFGVSDWLYKDKQFLFD